MVHMPAGAAFKGILERTEVIMKRSVLGKLLLATVVAGFGLCGSITSTGEGLS